MGGQLGGFLNGTLQPAGVNTWQAKGPGRTCLPTATASEQALCAPTNYFGTVVNGGNSVTYSQVELFAMGLVPAANTPSVQVALDGAWSNQANGTFTATQWQTVTPDQMLSASGGRIPPNASGQRYFRAATVVLTPNDVLDAATLNELNATLSGFAADDIPSYGRFGGVILFQNFYTATKGLATMRTGGLLSEAR